MDAPKSLENGPAQVCPSWTNGVMFFQRYI